MFYRKYRPQTIEDLDSEEIRQKMAASVSAKEFPHAFLFTGPKGTGKTSAARILAKAINCEKREGTEPCNKCDQCVSITNGNNLDILEIDGASNTGVDDVRDLREKIKLAPSRARYKVYIIDEVHMLSTSAFNALLKTLEEPPKHAVFILCTTEPQKVPETIKSRCVRITFKKATDEEIIRSLKRVARGEKIEIEGNVLDLIGHHAEGSFRDGVKILEQLLIEAKGKSLTEELARQILTSSDEVIEIFWKSLLEKKTKEALEWIERFVKTGGNISWLMGELISTTRENLLLSAGVMLEKEPAVRTDLKKEELIVLINLFTGAAEETKTAV
ncbi:MAG: DNA polymerase III subunit gamma/tau, partial [bacterium]|nr:DNA polymerase III subunit gamma/tau [bacterium]